MGFSPSYVYPSLDLRTACLWYCKDCTWAQHGAHRAAWGGRMPPSTPPPPRSTTTDHGSQLYLRSLGVFITSSSSWSRKLFTALWAAFCCVECHFQRPKNTVTVQGMRLVNMQPSSFSRDESDFCTTVALGDTLRFTLRPWSLFGNPHQPLTWSYQ